MANYWDSEDIFLDGDHYFDQLIKDIDEARELITVEMYIFNDDSLGKELASHLIQAHQRGVKVQIIVDGIGSYTFHDRFYTLFKNAGIKTKLFHPLPFYHPIYGKLIFKQRLRIFFNRLGSLNQRNHRKIVTIDNRIMFVGSYNFTAEHTKYHDKKKWKDMGARVTGPNVQLAILNFKKIWGLRSYYQYKKKIPPQITKKLKDSPLRINFSLFMRRFYNKGLLTRINQAQERIWLMTPYFIPRRRLIRALGKAAQRGVDVRIMISSKSDVKIFQLLQFFYYPYLTSKGVRVFHYTETVLHAKNFIIDDWITIGSSNLNHRSILHDLEVDLAIQEQNNKKIITDDFINSTLTQEEITPEKLKQRSIFDKFLCRVLFLFKYWF